jgi:hypothetical protein
MMSSPVTGLVDQPSSYPQDASCPPTTSNTDGYKSDMASQMISVPLSVSVGDLSCCEWRIQLPLTSEIFSFNMENNQWDQLVTIQIRFHTQGKQDLHHQKSQDSSPFVAFGESSMGISDEDPSLFDFLIPDMIV